jgi:hypothetical protein
MTIALVSFRAYGVEAEEAVNKRYKQVMSMSITAANTDVDIDFGDYSGTFWSAVSGSEPGTTALLAIKDIQRRAKTFLGLGGTGIAGKVQADASYTAYTSIDSSASAGGAATETLTVSGLLTTDNILAVSQFQKGANGTAIIDYGNASGQCGTNGQLDAEWTGNPGAGAKVRVFLSRTSTTVQAGTYQLAMDGTNDQLPNLLFVSGDAPTAYTVMLEWELKDEEIPVEVAG